MAYMSPMDNICLFEGRIANNIDYTSVNTVNGPQERVRFSIGVLRNLSKAERDAINNGGDQQSKIEFVNLSIFGNDGVTKFKNNYGPGKVIHVLSRYTTWTNTDNTGQQKKGHIFEVEKFWGCPLPSQSFQQGQQNNNGYQPQSGQQGYNNGYQPQGQPPAMGYQQPPQQNAQPQYNSNSGGYQQPPQQQNMGYQQPQSNAQQNTQQNSQNAGNFEMFGSSDYPF